jgi:hypothetical protein
VLYAWISHAEQRQDAVNVDAFQVLNIFVVVTVFHFFLSPLLVLINGFCPSVSPHGSLCLQPTHNLMSMLRKSTIGSPQRLQGFPVASVTGFLG